MKLIPTIIILLMLLFVASAQAAPTTVAPSHGSACTKTIANAGDDLSTFIATLTSGDVGCLKGGTYTDGCAVSWSLSAGSRTTLRNKPGEAAVLNTQLNLNGNNLTAYGLNVRDIAAGCGGDMSGFDIGGDNDEIQYSQVYNVTRHGVLTHTGTDNAVVNGNWVESVGSECNLDHGVYFQGSGGQITRNVFKDLICGYGIHLYSGPSNVLVSNNVVDHSHVRSGILINCATNCDVVNNIFINNEDNAGSDGRGIKYQTCTSGCTVDNNITYNNQDGATGGTLSASVTNNRNVDPLFSDALYHLSAASPAVGTGTDAFATWPDRDYTAAAVGTSDLGAYELFHPPNGVLNPQADTNTANVSYNIVPPTTTLTRDTGVYRSSPASFKIVGTAANAGAVWHGDADVTAGMNWQIANDPSDTVHVSAYVYGTAGDVVRIAVRERDAAGAFLRDSFSNVTIAATNTWQRIDKSVTVGADCYGHRVVVVGNTAMTFYVDDVQSTEGSTLFDYFPS